MCEKCKAVRNNSLNYGCRINYGITLDGVIVSSTKSQSFNCRSGRYLRKMSGSWKSVSVLIYTGFRFFTVYR